MGSLLCTELEPVLADEARQELTAPGPALLVAGGVAKTGSYPGNAKTGSYLSDAKTGSYLGNAKIGSYRSLLRQLSARSSSSGQGGSGAAAPAAERKSGEVLDLMQIPSSAQEEEHRGQLAHQDKGHVPNSGEYTHSCNDFFRRGDDPQVHCRIEGGGFLVCRTLCNWMVELKAVAR